MKKIAFVFILILLLSSSVSYAEEVKMLPLREILEDKGETVFWEEEVRKVVFTLNGHTCQIFIDEGHFLIDTLYIPIGYTPIIVDGQTVIEENFFKYHLYLDVSDYVNENGVK